MLRGNGAVYNSPSGLFFRLATIILSFSPTAGFTSRSFCCCNVRRNACATGVYLDSLKGMEPDEQRAKVQRGLETHPSSG